MANLSKKEITIFETAQYNFHQTAARLNLKREVIERLDNPKEKIEITAHPCLTNGRVVQVKSFIVRHNDARGPAKGGIRMTSTITSDDIVGLAMEMTWKTSLIGVH